MLSTYKVYPHTELPWIAGMERKALTGLVRESTQVGIFNVIQSRNMKCKAHAQSDCVLHV